MSNDLLPVAVLGIGAFGAYQGSQGKLPTGLQKLWDQYIGGKSGGTPTPITGVPTPAQILAWTQGLHVSTWIGTLYVADNGTLPPSVAALDTWGSSKGYYSNGLWTPPTGYN